MDRTDPVSVSLGMSVEVMGDWVTLGEMYIGCNRVPLTLVIWGSLYRVRSMKSQALGPLVLYSPSGLMCPQCNHP